MIVENGGVQKGNHYYGDVVGEPFERFHWTYSPAAELIIGSDFEDTIDAGDENDTIHGGDGNDELYPDEGYFTGEHPNNNSDDVVYGEGGNDTVLSWFGNDYIDGGDGDDVVWISTGYSTLIGGTGNDTFWTLEDSHNLIYAGIGDDSIWSDAYADAHSDTVYAGDGNDSIFEESGFNIIHGENGNDTIDSMGTLDGGDGNDNITLYGTGSIALGGNGDDYLSAHCYHAILYGNDGNDSIFSSKSGADLNGGDGDDAIYLFGFDITSNVDNTITGGMGNDSIYGTSDNALIIYSNNAHNEGYDSISITGNHVKIQADSDNTYIGLFNINGVDEITGNGHSGVRIQIGNGSNYWNFAEYLLSDIAGIDLSNQSDRVIGSLSSDDIRGRGGNDTISGFEGNDTLYGGAGDDKLYGDAGNDRVYGGSGADTLKGGAGADKFVFSHADESSLTSYDQILDFSQTDKDRIYLNAIDADTSVDGNQAFMFVGSAEFTHHAGELRAQFDGTKTQVFADVDGDAVADMRIDIIGNHTLLALDFYL